MTWLVQFTPRAQGEMRRLDRQAAHRILRALTRLAATGQGDVVRLRNQAGECRLRVGDWRVRFRYNAEAGTIEVLRVLPRGRAHRD